MENFAKQMEAAINTYAEMSGLDRDAIIAECANLEGETARIVSLLMFAAR